MFRGHKNNANDLSKQSTFTLSQFKLFFPVCKASETRCSSSTRRQFYFYTTLSSIQAVCGRTKHSKLLYRQFPVAVAHIPVLSDILKFRLLARNSDAIKRKTIRYLKIDKGQQRKKLKGKDPRQGAERVAGSSKRNDEWIRAQRFLDRWDRITKKTLRKRNSLGVVARHPESLIIGRLSREISLISDAESLGSRTGRK